MTITSRRTVIPHAFVIERRKQDLFDSARLDDFAVTPLQNLPDIDLRTVAPYSTNWTTGEMLFAHTPESALHAPFLYLAQYQQARFVALLDQAQAEENLPTGRESLRPVFVSSVGRCGSTLVSRLARAVGRSVISEPDAISRIPVGAPEGDHDRLAGMLDRIVAALAARADAVDPVIKLRSFGGHIVQWLSAAFPHARFVFLSRQPEAWVASHLRAFSAGPRTLHDILAVNAIGLDHLQRVARLDLRLDYEDLLSRPTEALASMLALELSTEQRAAAHAAMDHDSQEGLVPKHSTSRGEIEPVLRELRRICAASPFRDKLAQQRLTP